MDKPQAHRPANPDYTWEGVDRMPYKEEGAAPFRAISRQVLFDESAMGCQLRYFEMEEGGHSTLERHEHMHAVMILRGHGQCLLGDQIRNVSLHDLITIPAWQWHQFRANAGEPMGFLCMVNHERDKPQLPTHEERAALAKSPEIARFLES
jgi:quercetin dioxygenase-like cupin family protein